MSAVLPPVPQSNRRPITLSLEQEQRLLSRPQEADRSDPFATDADDAIRTLGKLALRREERDPADFFALGDLCAALSLNGEQLLVFYVGKALTAYRRAGRIAARPVDRELADRSVEAYIGWVLEVARLVPTPRNLAVGLWAAAELAPAQQPDPLRSLTSDLAKQYANLSDTPLFPVQQTQPELRLARSPERETVEMPMIRPDPPVPTTETPPTPPPVAPDGELQQIPLPAGPHDSPDMLETRPDFLEPSFEALDISEIAVSDSDDSLSSDLSDSSAERTSAEPGLRNPAAAAAPRMPLSSASRSGSQGQADRQSVQDFQHGDTIEGERDERYTVLRVLRGGMGIIYLCYDQQRRDTVAIKTFQGRLLENENARARFEQEALTWIHLEKHPHIVQARKIQTFSRMNAGKPIILPRPHILLEYIAGPEGLDTDLKSWIDHNRLDLLTSLEFGLHICLGMQHASRIVPGLVHRDLKPANVLVRYDGVAKVTDFGLARSLDSAPDPSGDRDQTGNGRLSSRFSSRLTRAGAIVGTVPYMSPEQCRAEEADLRSDIYSFGAILYEMLTRHQLFRVRTLSEWVDAHLNRQPEFPLSALQGVPAELENLVLRCLAKAREARPQNWAELADELRVLYRAEAGSPLTDYVDESAMEFQDLMDKAYGLTEVGHGEEALDAYDRAIALDPESDRAWARKGRTLRKLKRYDAALTMLDHALQLNPRFAWAWKEQGIVLEGLNRREAAFSAYKKAADTGAGITLMVALSRQANILLNDGKSAEALALLDHILADGSNHPAIYSMRGRVLSALHRYEDALTAYDAALKMAGRDFTTRYFALRDKAKTQLTMRRYADSEATLQELLELSPRDPQVFGKLGQAYRYLKRYEDALTAYRQALAIDPHSAWSWNEQGIVLSAMQRYPEALDAFRRAAQENPTYIWYWYNQAETLIAMAHFQEALDAIDQALEQDDTHRESWLKRGQALAALGRYKEAVTAYDQALATDPHYAYAWNARGRALELMSRHDEAILSYERAAQEDPTNFWYCLNQVDPLLALGRREDALAVCEQATTIAPGSPIPWGRQGQVLRMLERFEEAIGAYERSLTINPHDAWSWNRKGRAYAALERMPEALLAYERATRENPANEWLWYVYGDALLQLSRYEDSISAFNRALEANPHHSPSRQRRTEARNKLGQKSDEK